MGAGNTPTEFRFVSCISSGEDELAWSGNRSMSLFLRRRYKQNRRSKSRSRPAMTPMTIPAIAPPERPLEDDSSLEPAGPVGRPVRLPVTLAVSEPVVLGAGGSEAVLNPAGKGFWAAARIRAPQVEGESESRLTR
jgi:hypothetical protein